MTEEKMKDLLPLPEPFAWANPHEAAGRPFIGVEYESLTEVRNGR